MSFDRMDQMDWTYGRAMSQARRGTIVGQVMGLLAFSLLFTAGGYLVGRALGPAGIDLRGLKGGQRSGLGERIDPHAIEQGKPFGQSLGAAGHSQHFCWRGQS